MSKRSDFDLLLDIQEAIKRILEYGQEMSSIKFMEDIKTQDAVVRNLEIIGEASKNISSDLKNKYHKIAWSDLAKVRDKLIHHYFGVNLDIVWDIIEESLPQLSRQVQEILDKEKQ